MSSGITGGVQAMETEAARVLEEAESRAEGILGKARQEADAIATAELLLDEVKAETARIVKEAREKADAEMKRADQEAAGIREGARGKLDEYAGQVVDIISGKMREQWGPSSTARSR